MAVLWSVCAKAQAETITIVADQWCPYNCAPEASHPGLFIEIAHRVFEKSGITVEYMNMPWARALQDTRLGKYTAVTGALRGDAQDFVFPDIAQAQSLVTFYVKKGSFWRYDSLESLKRISLGTISNYSYGTTLDSYIGKYKNDMRRIQEVSGDAALESNAKKLLIGRIGALVETSAVMDYFLGVEGLRGQIVPAGNLPAADTQSLYIAFSPRNPDARRYADMVSAETRRLIQSGEMNTLRARYGLPPLPAPVPDADPKSDIAEPQP